MASSINDKLTQASDGAGKAIVAELTAQKLVDDSGLTVNSADNWPTETAVHFIIYQVDASGNMVAGTHTEWKGIKASDTSITGIVLKEGTDQVYPVGSKVIVSPTSQWANDVVNALLQTLNQDGTLKTGVVATAKIADSAVTTAKIADRAVTADKVTVSGASVYRSSNQAIPTGTRTNILFNAEKYDTSSYHDNSTNTSRLTVPDDGVYRVTMLVTYQASTVGVRQVELWKNGAFDVALTAGVNSGSADTGAVHSASVNLELDADDYIELVAYHTQGSDINIIGDASVIYTIFQIEKIGLLPA